MGTEYLQTYYKYKPLILVAVALIFKLRFTAMDRKECMRQASVWLGEIER